MQLEPSSVLKAGAFTGRVVHKREFDIEHGFDYPVWMALAPLPDGEDGSPSLPRLLQPRWSKYLRRSRIETLIGIELNQPADKVWLLTQPSLIGRSFNPVSFYFVERGSRICWIVAHITNTPWDEDHCYVLHEQPGNRWTFDKAFHVSPFMPMALRYEWSFRLQADRINIDMRLYRESRRVFVAALNLQAVAVNAAVGWKIRLMYPLQNLRTLTRIYYQAALLKLKGAQFYAHPDSSSIR